MKADKGNHRKMEYIGIFMILFIGFWVLRISNWQGSKELHTLMEVLAISLAAFVGILGLIRFYSHKSNTFLFIGTGFLGTAFLDGYHAVVTSTWFAHHFPSTLPSLIPWSWIAPRLFLSVFMWVSWAAWKRENRLGREGAVSETVIYVGSAVFTLASFLFFAFVPLPRAYYPEIIFHRPEEFVPALFFLLALVGYLKKGRWQTDAFEHWLVISLIVGFMAQVMFMSFSGKVFDMMFDAAHLLKKVSYICVLTGLSINLLNLLKQSIRNETETRRQRTLLDAISRVFKEAMASKSDEEFGSMCLTTAQELTGSRFGFFGEINSSGRFDTIAISNPGWEACKLDTTDAKQAILNMPLRGVDRSTMRDGQSRIVNDVSAHPESKGVPEGHPPVECFLGVPFKEGRKTIGMIGLANKPGGYEPADQKDVETLSAAIVEAYRRRRIQSALQNAVKAYSLFSEQVAKGDLTAQLEPTDDAELDTLTENLNRMVLRLNEIATQVRQATQNINGATAEVLSTTSQQAASTAEQSAAVKQTSVTVDQVRQVSENSASKAQQVSKTAQESTTLAEKGSAAVAATIGGMNGLKRQVASIAENILTLSEQTQQIEEILDTVKDIADQSNLLALNAAIEAARAGDAGKGFAVVAGEVRTLAEQSREATEKVRDILGEIQKSANSAVLVTEEGTKRADIGVSQAEKAGETIRIIHERIQKVTELAQQIAMSSREQLTGVDQINESMQNIDQAASETETGTKQVEGAAQNLNVLAERLKGMVAQYQLDES